MEWFCAMTEAVKAARLIEKGIVELAAQGCPWILIFPYQHAGIMTPHSRVETLLQCTVLLIVHQLSFFTEVVDSFDGSQAVNGIAITNIFVVCPYSIGTVLDRGCKIVFIHDPAHGLHVGHAD